MDFHYIYKSRCYPLLQLSTAGFCAMLLQFLRISNYAIDTEMFILNIFDLSGFFQGQLISAHRPINSNILCEV